MKLWSKGYQVDKLVEQYTVGNDHLLDKRLVIYDCQASQAHAEMLYKIGLLSKREKDQLIQGLNEIITLNNEDKFPISQEDEDCHTAIEKFLTDKLGETGKKIHTARSRNDQILTALRLYEKEHLGQVKEFLKKYQDALTTVIEQHGEIPLPGYTHMQKAMPASVEMWLGCFLASANDLQMFTHSVEKLIDQSPLGSAAGFGVPVFPVERQYTADKMGFSKVMDNSLYCQMSRGKFESTILHLLTQIMFDLNRLASDLILFSMKEFNYLELPIEFCTGSSIMPQKKNPDVLELMRAKFHLVQAEQQKMLNIVANLMSGYNRDVQLTKEPVFNAFDVTLESLLLITEILKKIHFNKDICQQAMTEELFATEEAYQLVNQGMPFREAYQKIGEKFIKK
ncbi:MAG: argininosuccinate lyase [Spirochaetes bacterium]|nr:argininosuccinate lyase [Spirochaetota bacterium]